MDFALAQLALVFMLGIIWANIDAKYGAGPRQPRSATLLVRAFLFGTATYSTLFLIYAVWGKDFGYPSFGRDPQKIDLFEIKDEIAWSIPLSFALSISWLWAVRYRFFQKFLHMIGASQRCDDVDVWSYIFNSDQAHVEYVHFRDMENGYVFSGYINAYSEDEECRELLFHDAIIYDEEGNEIYKSPFLYISRSKNSIWMEFPSAQKAKSERM